MMRMASIERFLNGATSLLLPLQKRKGQEKLYKENCSLVVSLVLSAITESVNSSQKELEGTAGKAILARALGLMKKMESMPMDPTTRMQFNDKLQELQERVEQQAVSDEAERRCIWVSLIGSVSFFLVLNYILLSGQ